jgi:hypothetical protein
MLLLLFCVLVSVAFAPQRFYPPPSPPSSRAAAPPQPSSRAAPPQPSLLAAAPPQFVFVHGFTHTGTSMVYEFLSHFPGWKSCCTEGQWCQTVFPAWNIAGGGDTNINMCHKFREWADADGSEAKGEALVQLVSDRNRALLAQEWTAPALKRSPGARVFVEKDPRFDTLLFFERMFVSPVTVLVMRHPFKTHSPSEDHAFAFSCNSAAGCLHIWSRRWRRVTAPSANTFCHAAL